MTTIDTPFPGLILHRRPQLRLPPWWRLPRRRPKLFPRPDDPKMMPVMGECCAPPTLTLKGIFHSLCNVGVASGGNYESYAEVLSDPINGSDGDYSIPVVTTQPYAYSGPIASIQQHKQYANQNGCGGTPTATDSSINAYLMPDPNTANWNWIVKSTLGQDIASAAYGSTVASRPSGVFPYLFAGVPDQTSFYNVTPVRIGNNGCALVRDTSYPTTVAQTYYQIDQNAHNVVVSYVDSATPVVLIAVPESLGNFNGVPYQSVSYAVDTTAQTVTFSIGALLTSTFHGGFTYYFSIGNHIIQVDQIVSPNNASYSVSGSFGTYDLFFYNSLNNIYYKSRDGRFTLTNAFGSCVGSGSFWYVRDALTGISYCHSAGTNVNAVPTGTYTDGSSTVTIA